VEYWLGLPIRELGKFMVELAEQIQEENEQAERAAKRR
jgi:hypothetical protein